MAVVQSSASEHAAGAEALSNQLLQATLGTMDIATVYLGDQLGLYRALTEIAPATPAELATRLGLNERYVREWLEQQTVSGILAVENPAAGPADRRFAFPAGHAQVLTEVDNAAYLAPLAQITLGLLGPLDAVMAAFRTGAGVPFAAYGRNLREGQAGLNRNLFLQQLGTEYLPAIPAINARLRADPPARIADIGCGHGWSAIGMARAYPTVTVDGFDLDEASVRAGAAIVGASDVADRVSIQRRDAADLAHHRQYDLVTAFECIHDLSDPVGVLRSMRALLAPGGHVLIMDERVNDLFTGEIEEVERFMYGCSVLHCLPVGLVDPPAAGTGTVMRYDTLRGYARAAGFPDAERLPLENFFFSFYLLNGEDAAGAI